MNIKLFHFKLILTTLLLCLFSHLKAQAHNHGLVDLERLVMQMDSVRNSNLPNGARIKTIDKINQQSLFVLISYAKSSANFMSDNLTPSENAIEINNHLFCKTSKNRQFRIVYWQSGLGGSIQDYQYTLFWKQQNRLNYKIIQQEDTILANSYIDTIYQFQYGSKVLYYVLTETGDRSYYSINLIGYRLEKNGNIEENPQAFSIDHKNLSQVSIPNYPNEYFANLVHFNNTGDTLYFPYMPSGSTKHKTNSYALPKNYVFVLKNGHFECVDSSL